MNSLLSSMRFYEAPAIRCPMNNSPILAHSVGQLAPMVFEKTRVYRLAPSKSLIHAVPELDPRFTQLPAKVDFLTLEQRREIDQPHVQIFHHAPELMNFLDGFFQRGRGFFPAVFLLYYLSPIHLHAPGSRQSFGEALPLRLHRLVTIS